VDLLGSSVYNVLHPEDHDILKEQFETKEDSRRSFFCRMMEKALSRNDPTRYEIVHIVGTLKPLPDYCSSSRSPDASKCSTDSVDSAFYDSEEDESPIVHTSSRIGSHVLICFVQVVKDRPITELSLVEATQDEYITRHDMAGKILYTDHRISFVTGLMPGEVLGTSAFQYMHAEDMVWSMVAHKLMFMNTQGQGLVSYRLKCKGGTLVTLRSRGYIEINKLTGQPESFVCINTLVSENEAKDEIKSQRRKLLPMIFCQQSEDNLTTVASTMPAELLSMMKQLMSTSNLHKMIAEVDETYDVTQNYDTNGICNEDSSLESSMSHEPYQKNTSSQQSSICRIMDHSNTGRCESETYFSGKSQKRKMPGDVCNLPKKIVNKTGNFRPTAEPVHHQHNLQKPAHLPNLSPDIMQPCLSPVSQNTPTFSHDKTLQECKNTCSNIQNTHHYPSTNNMHFVNSNRKGTTEFSCSGVSNKYTICSYQECRQFDMLSPDSDKHIQGPYSKSSSGDRFISGMYQMNGKIDATSQCIGATHDLSQNTRDFCLPGNSYMPHSGRYLDAGYSTQSNSTVTSDSNSNFYRSLQEQERESCHHDTHTQEQCHFSCHKMLVHQQFPNHALGAPSEAVCCNPNLCIVSSPEGFRRDLFSKDELPLSAGFNNVFMNSYSGNSHPDMMNPCSGKA
ncbi:hypothetical protein SK128_020134, partial [Halocaridina rubra]